MPDPADLAPLLIPRPARLDLHGGRAKAPAQPRVVRDPSLPAGGYRLTVTASAVEIVAGPGAGVRHAECTLDQLRAQYGACPPCCTIDDSPAFATRGMMLDISRDRVPTMDHLFRLVDHLEALKLNHLQLYTEHTFAYRGHEEVWRGCDPLTPAEVIELDARCRARGVELAANQNCFGHLARWLRLPEYAHLAETHGSWQFEYGGESFPRSGPFSLCPTDPASLEFVSDLLEQLLPCFTAGPVNIGGDETFDVGAGRSATAVLERGRTAVCMEFIRHVGDRARALGKRPQFWADMALRDPAAAPGDAVALVWDYEPGYPWTNACARLRGAELEAWVCPGTSAWRSITGRTAERRANLQEAAAQGAAAGATGFLITEWGDTGHHQQWPITLHAVAEAADAAWTGGAAGYDPRAAALHIFGDRTLGISAWLDELGDADLPLRDVCGRRGDECGPKRLRNSSALFVDLHMPLADTPAVDARTRRGLLSAPAPAWEAAIDRLRALEGDARWRSTPDMTAEIRHTLDTALLAAERALLRRGGRGPKARDQLADRLSALTAEHERLWLLRSRPGALRSSADHYRRVLDDLRAWGGAGGGGVS